MIGTKKRVSIFLPTLGGGGAERVMLNLATGFADSGCQVDLVLAQAEGPFLKEVPKSVRLIELNNKHLSSFRTLASLPELVKYLKHTRPNVLLSGLHANIVALLARFLSGIPKKVVISEHNTFSQKYQQIPAMHNWLICKLVKYFYPSADCIVAVSDGVADDLAKVTKISRERIRVIYNPIVTKEFKKKALAHIEHPWLETGEPPIILAVGRLTAQKDFGTLIKAFSLVRKSQKARLIIIGEGEERHKLETLVKQLGLKNDVSIPGFVSNPFPYMTKSSLFVLSSKWEGLPTVLIEALYCGCSIIATDCPSGPRQILRNGLYGRLVPVNDVSSLSKAIKVMLNNSTTRPGCESWQPYEIENVVKQYMSILL